MIDYIDLIERLRKGLWPVDRCEVSDALEAQAREIERLRLVISKDPNTVMIAYEDGTHQRLARELQKHKQHIEAQEARIAELEAALKPFADVANYFDNEPRYTDEDSPCEAFNTFGDLRAARAALGKTNDR